MRSNQEGNGMGGQARKSLGHIDFSYVLVYLSSLRRSLMVSFLYLKFLRKEKLRYLSHEKGQYPKLKFRQSTRTEI